MINLHDLIILLDPNSIKFGFQSLIVELVDKRGFINDYNLNFEVIDEFNIFHSKITKYSKIF